MFYMVWFYIFVHINFLNDKKNGNHGVQWVAVTWGGESGGTSAVLLWRGVSQKLKTKRYNKRKYYRLVGSIEQSFWHAPAN